MRPREKARAASAAAGAIARKRADREERLQRSAADLAFAWALSLLCGIGHLGHVWAGAPGWVHALHHPALSAALSATALLGERAMRGAWVGGGRAAWAQAAGGGEGPTWRPQATSASAARNPALRNPI